VPDDPLARGDSLDGDRDADSLEEIALDVSFESLAQDETLDEETA
jgi:hypothetical protein